MLERIQASGSFYDVGVVIGRRTGSRILALAGQALPMLLKNGFQDDASAMWAAAEGYGRAAEEFFPASIAYLHGVADGCGLERQAQLALAFGEELEFYPRAERCSTMVIWTADGPVIARNEDFWESCFEEMAIFDLTFDRFPRVVSLNYLGYMPHLGGSLGQVAIANDSLWLPTRHGIPKQVKHFRAALASSIEEAVGYLSAQPSSLSDHFTVADAHRAVSLEVSNAENAERAVERREIVEYESDGSVWVQAPFCHTNGVRWLQAKMPDPAPHGSHMRYHRLEAVAAHDPPRNAEDLEKLFSTRDGIIRRDREINLTLQPNSCTLATTIIQPGKCRFTALRYHRDGSHVRDVVQL